MIEFSGSYFQFPTSKAMSVLVQFDGAELHIWHSPEPFFRIATFDSFRILANKNHSSRSITLPNGARIETKDILAQTLANHFGKAHTLNNKWWHRPAMILVLLTGITLLFGIWILSHAGMMAPPG